MWKLKKIESESQRLQAQPFGVIKFNMEERWRLNPEEALKHSKMVISLFMFSASVPGLKKKNCMAFFVNTHIYTGVGIPYRGALKIKFSTNGRTFWTSLSPM